MKKVTYIFTVNIGLIILLLSTTSWASPQVAPGIINIISPNGGENWAQGSPQAIEWEAMRISGNVKISLWQNGIKLGVIATNVNPNSGPIPWIVGQHSQGTAPIGAGYYIKIKEIGSTITDMTDDPFEISAQIPGSITVTSPNGGENWTIGDTHPISWDASGLYGNLKISLWQNGVQIGVIAYDIGGETGSIPWLVGQHSGGTATPGTGYFIKIKELGKNTLDMSDASFQLSAPVPQITVNSPNGGENWVMGDMHNITWDATGLSANLKISLWQNGVQIGVIASGINHESGSFPWPVGDYLGGTATPGIGYTIKIKEIGTLISDTSNASFEIAPRPDPSITVTSPNGGETWQLGTTSNITWTATSLSANLKISLWKDGSQLGVIATDIDPSSGSIAWTVGEYIGGVAEPALGYKIRIKEIGTSILDTSDNSFEITPTPITWTIMVYLDADNNLESEAIDDFLEMASVGSSQNVNIVAQLDRRPGYDTRYDDWTTTKRYHITKGQTPTVANALEDIGEANMGDPATLSDFMGWAKANYPATNYALILWDHGDGWRQLQGSLNFKAVCWDDTSQDELYMSEVKSGLSSGGGAGTIGFDACLMGMVEVAYEIRDLGQVMVASEEVVPIYGWPYDTILSDLVLHPYWTHSQLGTNIVDNYYASYGNDYTKSAIDLTSMDALATTIDNFCISLLSYWNSTPRRVKAAAVLVMAAIDNCIIYEKHTPSWPGAHGLAIYFPRYAYGFSTDYDGAIIDFPKDVLWEEFLIEFYSSMSGSWIDTARGMSQVFYYSSHIDLYHFCEVLQSFED
jgi:hypothetical protein